MIRLERLTYSVAASKPRNKIAVKTIQLRVWGREMKSYAMWSLSLEVTQDADIIALLETLKRKREASQFLRQAIREKMERDG